MVKSRMTKRQYSTKHSTIKIEQYEPHPSCYSCQKSRDKSYSVIPHDRGMKDGVLTTANIKNPWSSFSNPESRLLSGVTHLPVQPFQI